MRSTVNPGDDVIDRGAARRVRQVICAPRAAPVLPFHQFGHECQAVRCPRHTLAVTLPITSPAAKRPAAEPLPGRHRQPAHTAPARLRKHEHKLTGPSDIEIRHCPLLPWRLGCWTGLIAGEQSSQAVAASRAAYDPKSPCRFWVTGDRAGRRLRKRAERPVLRAAHSDRGY
jgi:hypothetical protein